MTLIIKNDCHDPKSPFGNTISVYGKPNGAVKNLISKGFVLNPRVHDDPVSEGVVTDGSLVADPSSAQDKPSTPFFTPESKSGEPSEFIGEAD